MRRWFALSLMILMLGCASKPLQEEAIALDQVPPELLKIAREKLPQVQFQQAWKRANGIYEIRGKDKRGKIREIDLNEKGEVLEIE